MRKRWDLSHYPDERAVEQIVLMLKDVLFCQNPVRIRLFLERMEEQLVRVCEEKRAHEILLEMQGELPNIYQLLQQDLQAAMDGDPAARSREEVLLSYPGFFACVVYRVAHFLYERQVKLLPRMMTEIAHSRTGIDIHPGAKIGSHFFMDHGTGIVIGETTVIGNGVKLYQGVTLGALSTRNVENIRKRKRHPTIEDDVTIYAGVSILGGDTVIGKGSTIGANVFITSSMPENSVIRYDR